MPQRLSLHPGDRLTVYGSLPDSLLQKIRGFDILYSFFVKYCFKFRSTNIYEPNLFDFIFLTRVSNNG